MCNMMGGRMTAPESNRVAGSKDPQLPGASYFEYGILERIIERNTVCFLLLILERKEISAVHELA